MPRWRKNSPIYKSLYTTILKYERTGNFIHLYYDNCNDAFLGLVQGFQCKSFLSAISPIISQTSSRNGPVLTIEEPVTITYRKPWRRVLFNKGRDANPFFHLIEALWCLAGRDDIDPLMYFVPQVAEYSDDGKTWAGAYGKRWKHPLPGGKILDQLLLVITALKNSPNTRRVVLQMWLPTDLWRVVNEPSCKDVPCNTMVMFSLRSTKPKTGQPASNLSLDMTVVNRSNDMVWGMLGSNYVTFTILQEYIACAVDAEIGLYHHISNNLHVYLPASFEQSVPNKNASNLFNPEKFLADPQDWYGSLQHIPGEAGKVDLGDGSSTKLATCGAWYLPQRMYADRTDFDNDCRLLFSVLPQLMWELPFNTPFFKEVIHPMLEAWHWHKQKDYTRAQLAATVINAADWKHACRTWLDRRDRNRKTVKATRELFEGVPQRSPSQEP